MFLPVWEHVVRGGYRRAEAVVEGCQRYDVTGETYPGMIQAAEQSVHGVVYFHVDASDLATLDAFEGEDYRREALTAVLGSGERIAVAAYLYLPVDRLSQTIWEPEGFRMQQFLDTYCRARIGTD